MKAVVYHADANIAKTFDNEDLYEELFHSLKDNLNTFGIDLIHITVTGHPGWGNENYYYDVEDVNNVVYNREICFIDFLENIASDDEVYWFTEPDTRLLKEFPVLEADLALLLRGDSNPVTPAWRLARRSALPIFKEALNNFNLDKKDWNGDSPAWYSVWQQFGEPRELGVYSWNDLNIELRSYQDYCSRKRPIYSSQYKGHSKNLLLDKEK